MAALDAGPSSTLALTHRAKDARSSGLSIFFIALALRSIITTSLALFSAYFSTSTLDTSHRVVSPIDSSGLLRWDALHFASIAKDGYQYEQQSAFFPGWPMILHLAGQLFRLVRTALQAMVHGYGEKDSDLLYSDIIAGGGYVNIFASAGATLMLHKLTYRLTQSLSFSNITAALYFLPPTPATIAAPYTEPLYALLTFLGFYLSADKRWISASLALAAATSIRSTGLFSIGVLGWHILFGSDLPNWNHLKPKRLVRAVCIAIPLFLVVLSPFLGFQYYAYASFCNDPATFRPWCNATIPSAYSFVQGEYWNVGFLKYWTMAQLPNLLIAAPVLIVSFYGSYTYFRCLSTPTAGSADPSVSHALLPFHIHHLFLTVLLLVNAHTQIALRVAITDPVVWWNVAAIAFDWRSTRKLEGISDQDKQNGAVSISKRTRRMRTAGKVWVGWCVVWSLVSIVLWLGHYPPA